MSMVAQTWLYVNTAKHSLVTLWREDGELYARFADEVDRDGLNHIYMSNDITGLSHDVVMVSDKSCSVAGLYSGGLHGPRQLVLNSHTLFEAELPASVLKFRRGNTRPSWDRTWRRDISENAGNSKNRAESLGVSIDGSIRHFTILEEFVWRLLSFLQDHAFKLRSGSSSADHYRPAHWRSKPDPRMKHIDGDILRQLLRRGELEKLLIDSDDMESDDEHIISPIVEKFCLLGLDIWGLNNRHAAEEVKVMCIEETYRLLETLLRPVL
jgi:hypothetical protein